ncbi:MAG: TRM11 family SAM-dependent methyltransferase [Chloroflexota bacterium]
MPILVARVAPQKSTQYAALASSLALPEWQMSPLSHLIRQAEMVTIGGGDYLRLALTAIPEPAASVTLGLLAMTSEFFEYHDRIGAAEGPFLKPLEVTHPACVPPDLVFTRRYRGKTNELFARFLLNAACFASDFAPTASLPRLTLLDPLCGGGTTLFQALVYGWDAYGLELDEKDVSSTQTFLQQYLRGQGIQFSHRKERLRGLGRRHDFELATGQGRPQRCVLIQADTADTPRALEGKTAHLIVADLPYGVQHKGILIHLLETGLPVWGECLRPGGALALAWESSRLPRQEMITLVEAVSNLKVRRGGPFEALAHRVDRVIKRRDVVIATKTRLTKDAGPSNL